MFIRVDPQSAEPIFEQIVFQVKAAVARGDLSMGDKLPSVRQLARDVAVNPNTVVRAYEMLERDGVIVRRQGAGCFVKQSDASAKTNDAQKAQLAELMERAVTEAFHTGASAKDIRAALARALDAVRFSRGGKRR